MPSAMLRQPIWMVKRTWKHYLFLKVFQTKFQLVNIDDLFMFFFNFDYFEFSFAEKLHNIGSIECDQPLADLYTFNGRLEIGPTFFWRQNHEPTFSDTLRRHRRTLPLTADHLLLRGSRIKNTEWAIGCAVYTGQQTKLALNGQIFRTKTSSSEKFINHFLIFFLLVMLALVIFCFAIKMWVFFLFERG